MQNLIITSLLAMMGLALTGLIVYVTLRTIKRRLTIRAWEKRIKANRDDIARGLDRRA